MARHRYEQIAEVLRREIETGRWPPGTRLPPTGRLMARFEVSRMTLRHALELLRRDGLVQTRRGAGVFVLDRAGEVPRPRRPDEPTDRLITRLDELEERVLGDLAEINGRLDSIEARLGD